METELEKYRKKAATTWANVNWLFIVFGLSALIFGITVLFFQILQPYTDAFGGGFFFLGITFVTEEISRANDSRKHAKEMFTAEERAIDLKKQLMESNHSLEEIKGDFVHFGVSVNAKLEEVNSKLSQIKQSNKRAMREKESAKKPAANKAKFRSSREGNASKFGLYFLIIYSGIILLGIILLRFPIFGPYTLIVEACLLGLGIATFIEFITLGLQKNNQEQEKERIKIQTQAIEEVLNRVK
jgi:hypothetical protein